MKKLQPTLHTAYQHALDYRSKSGHAHCLPNLDSKEMLEALDESMPEDSSEPDDVIKYLAHLGKQGLIGGTSRRFFGWVAGASHPAGVAADWLVSAWGQNSSYQEPTPTTSALEEIAQNWLLDILDLPRYSSVGFTTGATVGNFVALAAARGATLRKYGWDVDKSGLFGAPAITVYLGKDAHVSVSAALMYLGLGYERVIRIKTDDMGRMISDDLEHQIACHEGPKIVIGQAGQINTGAFDPFKDIADIAHRADAWLHIDAAFGLWARANPDLKHLTDGIDQADSWTTDGHKWLQTPFDTGYAIIKDSEAHLRAMSILASYLPKQDAGERNPSSLVPELSRRGRGVPTWAMLKTLGRNGIAEMVGRHCSVARYMAQELVKEPGINLHNDVVLNQVLIDFGNEHDSLNKRKANTEGVISGIQKDGICFMGGAIWRDRWVMRISVISGDTTIEDGRVAISNIKENWRKIQTL